MKKKPEAQSHEDTSLGSFIRSRMTKLSDEDITDSFSQFGVQDENRKFSDAYTNQLITHVLRNVSSDKETRQLFYHEGPKMSDAEKAAAKEKFGKKIDYMLLEIDDYHDINPVKKDDKISEANHGKYNQIIRSSLADPKISEKLEAKKGWINSQETSSYQSNILNEEFDERKGWINPSKEIPSLFDKPESIKIESTPLEIDDEETQAELKEFMKSNKTETSFSQINKEVNNFIKESKKEVNLSSQTKNIDLHNSIATRATALRNLIRNSTLTMSEKGDLNQKVNKAFNELSIQALSTRKNSLPRETVNQFFKGNFRESWKLLKSTLFFLSPSMPILRKKEEFSKEIEIGSPTNMRKITGAEITSPEEKPTTQKDKLSTLVKSEMLKHPRFANEGEVDLKDLYSKNVHQTLVQKYTLKLDPLDDKSLQKARPMIKQDIQGIADKSLKTTAISSNAEIMSSLKTSASTNQTTNQQITSVEKNTIKKIEAGITQDTKFIMGSINRTVQQASFTNEPPKLGSVQKSIPEYKDKWSQEINTSSLKPEQKTELHQKLDTQFKSVENHLQNELSKFSHQNKPEDKQTEEQSPPSTMNP